MKQDSLKDSLFVMQGLAQAELAELRRRKSSQVLFSQDVEDALSASLKDASRVIDMMQHFRQNAKQEGVPEQRAGYSSIIESVYQVLHAMTYECPFNNITILKILPHTLPEIPVAQVHLDTILFQLAANARRNIGHSSGIITIEAASEIAETEMGEKTFFKIRVSDTGPGIPLATIDEIFDPLVMHKGKLIDNIALCLVRKLVEVNNGRIYATSSARGTSFIIDLEFGA